MGFRKFALLALLLLLLAVPASADESLPLLPGGVVFPEYNSKGLGNPGTLNFDESSLLRLLVAPDILGSTTQVLDLDYTRTATKWGLDLGYTGSRSTAAVGNDTITHVFRGGLGVRFDALGLGASYSQSVGGAVSTSNLEAGIAYTMGTAQLGILFDHLAESPALTAGFGVRKENAYAIEFNLGLPSFAQGFTTAGSVYRLILATSLYLKTLGVGYVTTHPMSIPGEGQPGMFDTPFTLLHQFSLLYKFTPTGTFSIRVDSAGVVTFGVTFKL